MREIHRSLRRATTAKLRLQDPGGAWSFDVNSIRADYGAPLESCVAACRLALNRLNYVVIGGDLRDSEARIDARSDLFELARINLVARDRGDRTSATFTSGRLGREVSRFLKEEFERCLDERWQVQP